MAVAGGADTGAAAAAPAAVESKKEEKEESEEEDVSLSWHNPFATSTLILHYSYFENCPNHSLHFFTWRYQLKVAYCKS